MASYTELEVILSSPEKGRYQVDLEYRRPGGEMDIHPLEKSGPVEVNFDLETLQKNIHDAKAYGRLLTKNLFANPEVEKAFCDVLTSTRSIRTPLRIKLVILSNAAELQDLHWETLHSPDDYSPLTTSENLLFSRLLRSADFEDVQLGPKSDLRALVVLANPSGLDGYGMTPIDTERELARIQDSMGSMQWASVPGGREYHHASIDTITEALRNGPYHLLLMVCHGQIVDSKPWLWLEDEQGKVKRISGEEFARRLSEMQQRPLVAALVSCESAGTEEGMARAALGPLLVSAGVPVVLAMQGSVSMQTMDRYMPSFIRELLRDGQADRAAAVARGVVREDHDYWMPVLFSRLSRGRIFTEPEVSDEERSQRVGQSFAAAANVMRDPAVREAMVEYKITFRQTSEHIQNIDSYKKLHDKYQELELEYPLIEEARTRIPEKVEDAWLDVQIQTLTAGSKIDDLLKIAQAGEVMIDVPLWRESLEDVKSGLQDAHTNRDESALFDTCELMRSLLKNDIADVNRRLVAQTKSLQLEEILLAMSRIRDLVSSSGKETKVVDEISQGVEDLAVLNTRLSEMVSTHDKWQMLDSVLRLGDNALENNNMNEFSRFIWPKVKKLGTDLYGGQQAVWAVTLQLQEKRLDNSVTQQQTEKIVEYYDPFTSLGSQRFRDVDKELLALCTQLQKIGDSLQLLIRIYDE